MGRLGRLALEFDLCATLARREEGLGIGVAKLAQALRQPAGAVHFASSGQVAGPRRPSAGCRAANAAPVRSPIHRSALATGTIRMQPATLALITGGNAKQGDVIGIARIAAIQAAKRTAELIPLCHPLPLTRVAVALEIGGGGVDRQRTGISGRAPGRSAGVETALLSAPADGVRAGF